MRVLVTGGTGSIGSAIVRKLAGDDDEVIVFSRDEYKQHELKQELGNRVKFIIGDIRSQEALSKALRGVYLCFHTAAMKHVPICEENPYEAVQTNIIGTQNLINAAIENNVAGVLAISTDKAVHPTSVLGCSKLIMERLLKSSSTKYTKFASIRFGNILNSRGSVLQTWQKQVKKNMPVTVTDDRATRYFIEIETAVSASIEAAAVMQGGEVFIADCGKPRRIYDMAKAISSDTVTTGLRAGERLHEELVASNECANPTRIKGLLVV